MRIRILSFALVATVALAAGVNYSVIVNGQVTPDQAIVVNGRTYVPLSALKLLGVNSSLKGSTLTLGAQVTPATAPGGANQRASLEGCVGDTLFNGVWRLTVRSVDAIGPNVGLGPGWGVTVEVRNGTTTKTQLIDTGLTAIQLVQPDGNTLTFEEHDADEKLIYKDMVQASGVTYQLKFHAPDVNTPASSVPRPAKLLVQFDPKKLTAGYLRAAKVAFSTPTPGFRVDLTCRK